MINAQTCHSIKTMELDLEMDLSTIRSETGKTIEIFLLHRLKGETFHKIIHTANQEVINLTLLPPADLTIDLRLVLRPTNTNFHKTITRRHLMWVRFTTTDVTFNELSDICIPRSIRVFHQKFCFFSLKVSRSESFH